LRASDLDSISLESIQDPRNGRLHRFAPVDMRTTCDQRFPMSRVIQIRNVSDEVHRKLRNRAAKEGVTLSELLGREARRLAEQPTLEELRERLLSRPRVKVRTPSAAIIRQGRDRR
jgi:plasmid stability protein